MEPAEVVTGFHLALVTVQGGFYAGLVIYLVGWMLKATLQVPRLLDGRQ